MAGFAPPLDIIFGFGYNQTVNAGIIFIHPWRPVSYGPVTRESRR